MAHPLELVLLVPALVGVALLVAKVVPPLVGPVARPPTNAS